MLLLHDTRSAQRYTGDGSPPLRVGQFTDSFPPVINGVSAFVAEHHAELLAQGQQAQVFTFGYLKHRDGLPNVWRSPGLPMGTSPFRTSPVLSLPAHRAAATLDVLHAHEPFAIGQIAARYSVSHGRPLIFTIHTRHDLYLRNYLRLLHPFLHFYITRTIASLLRHSTLSTAPSRDTARWLQSLAPDVAHRVRVVCNGIRLDEFDVAQAPAARDAFGISGDQTLFVYVGRVSPEKNLKTFAEALIRAVDAGADAHWLIIGDGPARAALQAQLAPIRERSHFLGAVPRAQVPRLLAMADVFASPSLSEVNPVSVIEAMACGKPFLGLHATWWDEFSDNENPQPAGVLCGHNAGELAAAIRRLCDDRALRLQMGAQARRLSRRFDIRSVTAQWIDIYRSVEESIEIQPAGSIQVVKRFFRAALS
jgi:glycosyltransferase involved in cell wall biosynthesis